MPETSQGVLDVSIPSGSVVDLAENSNTTTPPENSKMPGESIFVLNQNISLEQTDGPIQIPSDLISPK